MIELRRVAVHNLKQIDLDLPAGRLIVVCGKSGSGKTSLALDTLYAEGQRRYIESFSAHERKFLEKLEKPAAERIDGLSPAVAIADRGSRPSRGVVGDATEILDFARLLYAQIGEVICLGCGRVIARETPDSVAERLQALPSGERFQIAIVDDEEDPLSEWSERWRAQGLARGVVGERSVDLSNAPASLVDDGKPRLVIVDRLTVGSASGSSARLRESLETAFALGEGRCGVLLGAATIFPIDGAARTIDGDAWRLVIFRQSLRCDACDRDYPEQEPRLFNYNSPLGACPVCQGAGERGQGTGETRRVSEGAHETVICPACRGDRLRPEALATRIAGKNISEFSRLAASQAASFLDRLELSDDRRAVASPSLSRIAARLAYLREVGLGYLALDRPLDSLSTGEARRVQLSTALASSLVNLLYVLDEPAAGLHGADAPALIRAIERLRDRGNTIVAVEHSAAMLQAADWLVEIGPGAGERGGEVSFQGELAQMLSPGASITGEYLAGRQAVVPEKRSPRPSRGSLHLRGARGRNLKNLDVDFPLGALCLVTGVSGAGKSSLVLDTLYGAVLERLGKPAQPSLPYDSLTIEAAGGKAIEDCLVIDRQRVSKSPRSNPVTYIKAFDDIRAAFAETPEAKRHGFTASHFSFNVEVGRCPTCQGDGELAIDMQFLPDVTMVCPDCRGARYRPEILAATYRGQSIADVLAMTVRESFSFFRGQTKLQGRLKKLIDVGLDYIRLGQSAATLSGGESQRLKMAGILAASRKEHTLFLIEEPASGLHFADVATLIDCFDALVGVGHSLIVIDHHLDLIRAADHIIDLGPGAAEEGGQIVGQGDWREIAACERSATGRLLRDD